MSTDRTVHTTTDYKKFKFLIDNRQTARGHINKLKNAIASNPEILKVQPILVNEKFEIIDGQHRFNAASELGMPVSYVQVPGLNIATARDMNVMQRRWGIEDYAFSYAKAGNVNYKAFNKYVRENPGISKTIIMVVLGGRESENMGSDFRAGKFIIKRDKDDAEWIFEQLNKIREITNGEIPISKPFVSGLSQAIDNEDFDYQRFLENLQKKPDMFHRTAVVRDALRMIEDIHNYHKSTNLIRLY